MREERKGLPTTEVATIITRPVMGTPLCDGPRANLRTQGQTLSALLVLYKHVLGALRRPVALVGALLHGSGLRLMECLTLRVKDVDRGEGPGERAGAIGPGPPGPPSRAGPAAARP